MKRLIAVLFTLAFAVAGAQDKPMKIIVPYPAGGNADNIARLYADALSKQLHVPVIVDNKGGGGGIIGAQAAMNAPSDGSVLFLAPTAVFVVTPHLRKVPYDANKDFIPVARVTSWIPVMVARKDFPANDFRSAVEAMKKSPGKYSFASAGPATMTHLMGELMNMKLGVQTLHVPYKGSSEIVPDLLSGRVDLAYDSVVVPQVKAGQLKVFASMAPVRHPDLPNVPTLKELGVDLDIPNWYGLFVPKGTPAAVVEKLGAVSKDIIAKLDPRSLTAMSMYAAYEGPAQFKAQIARDDALMADVIRTANVHVQ